MVTKVLCLMVFTFCAYRFLYAMMPETAPCWPAQKKEIPSAANYDCECTSALLVFILGYSAFSFVLAFSIENCP
jgi:hypothetical protein